MHALVPRMKSHSISVFVACLQLLGVKAMSAVALHGAETAFVKCEHKQGTNALS